MRAVVGVIRGIGYGEREEEEAYEASCRATRKGSGVGRSKVVEKGMVVLYLCMQKCPCIAECDFVHGYAQQGCTC